MQCGIIKIYIILIKSLTDLQINIILNVSQVDVISSCLCDQYFYDTADINVAVLRGGSFLFITCIPH